MDDKAHDEELAARQDSRLYPVGQALRASFDAENHDTLGGDVAGLMINLSHVAPLEPPRPIATPPKRVGLMSRVMGLFGAGD